MVIANLEYFIMENILGEAILSETLYYSLNSEGM